MRIYVMTMTRTSAGSTGVSAKGAAAVWPTQWRLSRADQSGVAVLVYSTIAVAAAGGTSRVARPSARTACWAVRSGATLTRTDKRYTQKEVATESRRGPHLELLVIRSFQCRDTQKLFSGLRVRRFVNFEAGARRKLEILAAAHRLDDLRSPPGNRLEQLRGDRDGQYSIRINDQFRICFRWNDGAEDVEIVDYH